MATSQSENRTTSSGLTSSLEARHASHFQLTESVLEWLTFAANCRCGSVRLWLAASRDGSYGKTSKTLLGSTEEGLLPASFSGWGNSGIAVRGECWTLDTSEFPSDGAECSLSRIIDRGDTLGRCYLSREQMAKMLRRLEKYGKENELTQALRAALSDGPETKPQSTE